MKFDELYNSLINEAKEEVELEGYVKFLLYAKGSKSESYRPALEQDGKILYRLYYVGDNEFVNETFKSLKDKKVKIKGTLYTEADLIRVTNVEEIPEMPEEINLDKADFSKVKKELNGDFATTTRQKWVDKVKKVFPNVKILNASYSIMPKDGTYYNVAVVDGDIVAHYRGNGIKEWSASRK
jgi:hypothetical protein